MKIITRKLRKPKQKKIYIQNRADKPTGMIRSAQAGFRRGCGTEEQRKERGTETDKLTKDRG